MKSNLDSVYMVALTPIQGCRNFTDKGYGKDALALIIAAVIRGNIFEGQIQKVSWQFHPTDELPYLNKKIREFLKRAGFNERLEFQVDDSAVSSPAALEEEKNGLGVLVGVGLSADRKINIQMTDICQRNPSADVKDFNPEEPSVFTDVNQDSIPKFYRFFRFSLLKLDIKRIRSFIKTNLHLCLLKPIGSYYYNIAIKFFVNYFQRFIPKFSIYKHAALKARQGIVGFVDGILNLMFSKTSLPKPQFAVICVDNFTHRLPYTTSLNRSQVNIAAASSPADSDAEEKLEIIGEIIGELSDNELLALDMRLREILHRAVVFGVWLRGH